MAQQSVGAGMQNLMLAAHALGLASYWISAPLFAADAVREALELPAGFRRSGVRRAGLSSDGRGTEAAIGTRCGGANPAPLTIRRQ